MWLVPERESAGALVQWLKLPAWNVGDRGFDPRSGIQVSNEQGVSSPLIHKNSILWGTSVTERSRILNPVSEGQCHNILLTILRMFSWPGLAYIESLRVSGEGTFRFLKLECQNPRSPTFQASSFNHCGSPPPPAHSGKTFWITILLW